MQFSAIDCTPGPETARTAGWHAACHSWFRRVGGFLMPRATRVHRRRIYRIPRERYVWASVAKSQARRALCALVRRGP